MLPPLSVRLVSISVAAFASLLAGQAYATDARWQTVGGVDAHRSSAATGLRYEHHQGLDMPIDTGFMGSSNSNMSAEMRALLRIDPVGAEPLFTIDMERGALLEAQWSDDRRIFLRPMSNSGGNIRVRYTLTPSIDLRLSVLGTQMTLAYDSGKILRQMQDKWGSSARFAYDSFAQQVFSPWGFTNVEMTMNAPTLSQSGLFSIDLGGTEEGAGNFDGDVSLRAVTQPTFSYRTNHVWLSAAGGMIDGNDSDTWLQARDGDFLDTMVGVEGEMNVRGVLSAQPVVRLTKIPASPTPVAMDIPMNVKTVDYTLPPQPVVFQQVLVHIPLPNVHLPRDLEIGEVDSNESVTKTITITNTGEKEAAVAFETSESKFQVPGGTHRIPPKGSYELDVTYAAGDDTSPDVARITIHSNDPAEPELIFRVGANGGVSHEEMSGCGCKTASSSRTSWQGLGALGLALAMVARRFRKAARA